MFHQSQNIITYNAKPYAFFQPVNLVHIYLHKLKFPRVVKIRKSDQLIFTQGTKLSRYHGVLQDQNRML